MTEHPLPLAGIRVLDFSTLLPGPLATLILVEAGAEVTKVERPGVGDEMRAYEPKVGADSANFVLLNRGKSSLTADLKDPAVRAAILERARDVDVWVEQFRPGVLARLGLGYDDVRAVNEGIIYCSITGYGQSGPDAKRAGHDLNYLAESGLVGDVVDAAGDPHLPPVLAADIAGGTYPAVMNILLALMRRERTGLGVHLDISMTRNLQPLAYGAIATRAGSGAWPRPGRGLLTGGSPRYAIYRTSDGRHLAAAPLEQRFWDRFTELIDLPPSLRQDEGREREVLEAVGQRIRRRPAEQWRAILGDEDVCCSIVATFAEAEDALRLGADNHHRVRGADGPELAALPMPLDPRLRRPPGTVAAPRLAVPTDPAGTR